MILRAVRTTWQAISMIACRKLLNSIFTNS